MGGVQKHMLGKLTKQICAEVLFMSYKADHSGLKEEVYRLCDEGKLIVVIAEQKKDLLNRKENILLKEVLASQVNSRIMMELLLDKYKII